MILAARQPSGPFAVPGQARQFGLIPYWGWHGPFAHYDKNYILLLTLHTCRLMPFLEIVRDVASNASHFSSDGGQVCTRRAPIPVEHSSFLKPLASKFAKMPLGQLRFVKFGRLKVEAIPANRTPKRDHTARFFP